MKKFLFIIFLLYSSNAFANQLINAVSNNAYKQADSLLNAGINPNLPGTNNNTALMQASIIGNVEMVKLLLFYKADPNKKDIANTTALHLAVRQGNIKVVELLLKAGADLNAQDFSGATPLIRAINKNRLDILATILSHKPNLYIKNKSGKTSQSLALEKKNPNYINLLIKEIPYIKIPYLDQLHKQALQLGKNKTAALITMHIAHLKENRKFKENLITLKRSDIAANYNLKDLPKFPCLNNDIEEAEIASNFCINYDQRIIFYTHPIIRQYKILNPGPQISLKSLNQHLTLATAAYREWMAGEFKADMFEANPVATNDHIEFAPIPSNTTSTPVALTPALGSKLATPSKTNSPRLSFKAANRTRNFVPGEILDQSLINPVFATIIALNPNFPKEKPFARNPNDLSKNNISEYSEIDLVRTNEWSINTYNVPLSTIDYETLGADMVFNRKFTYNEDPKSPTFSPRKKRFKSKARSYKKVVPAKKVKTAPAVKIESGYFIQLGIFSNFTNAKRLAKKARDFGKTTIAPTTIKGKDYTKVLIGPFKNKGHALRTQKDSNFIYMFGSKTLVKHL